MGWIYAAAVWGFVLFVVSLFGAWIKAKQPGDLAVWLMVGWSVAFVPTVVAVTGMVVSYRIQQWLLYVG